MKRVCQNGFWGAEDNGTLVIPCIYEEFKKFHDGVAWVKKDGKWGQIDKTGAVRIPCEYEEMKWGWFRKDGKWGVISLDTREVTVPFEFEEISKILYTPAKAKRNGKWGVISNRGRILVPFDYDEIRLVKWYGLGRGLAYLRKDEKWGLANVFGEELLPCVYDFISYAKCGLIRVKKDGKWGYVDERGAAKIPIEYDYALDAQVEELGGHGYVRVKKNGKWGVMDPLGNQLLLCEYDRVIIKTDIENSGYFHVFKGGEECYDWRLETIRQHKWRE